MAASNPHDITISKIGAAPTTHTHTGTQVTGNISGNATNITGICAIANGGTGANTVAAARTNLQVAMTSIPYTFNPGWNNHASTWMLPINKFSNLVVITGLVARTSGTNNTILVLPSTCRPTTKIMSICWGYWNNGYTIPLQQFPL